MKSIFSLLFVCITFSVFGQMPKIKFDEYKLKNGLTVLLHEDHSTPIVAVSIMYHVGAKNEDPNRTGFAHFFEHLLFEGSENIARGEFFKYIENNIRFWTFPCQILIFKKIRIKNEWKVSFALGHNVALIKFIKLVLEI